MIDWFIFQSFNTCILFIAILSYYLAKGDAKAEILVTLTNETLPFYMSKLENTVNENKGYFVNGKVPNTFIKFHNKFKPSREKKISYLITYLKDSYELDT